MTTTIMLELNNAINQANRGIVVDLRCVKADMIKQPTRRVEHTHLLRLHNRAIKSNEEPPSNWLDPAIKVTYQSGVPLWPSNY